MKRIAGLFLEHKRWIAVVCLVVLGLSLLFILSTGKIPDTHSVVPTVKTTPLGGASPTLQKQSLSTSDPCASAVVAPDVEKMHTIMLEFYDASALASQTPSEKLLQIIPSLQEIRRRADSLKVSACLSKLKSYQLAHMNTVINTMMAFMGKADSAILIQGIAQSRLINEEYKREKARVLGEIYIPPATAQPTAQTPLMPEKTNTNTKP